MACSLHTKFNNPPTGGTCDREYQNKDKSVVIFVIRF